MALSQPGLDSSKEDLRFFIKDIFTGLQIEGIEFKKKALESLLHLLDGNELGHEGRKCWVSDTLARSKEPVRDWEQAAFVVSVLASANDKSCKAVFEEGGLGLLLRILETGSKALKEKAAIAVEAITTDPDNAWTIFAYGGVSILVKACRYGSRATQTQAYEKKASYPKAL